MLYVERDVEKFSRILYGRNHCFSCDISHWMYYIWHYHWSDVKWIWNWLKRQGDRQLLIDLNEVHAGRMKPISQWLQWLTLQFMHLVFAKGVSSIQPNVWTQWNENQSIEWMQFHWNGCIFDFPSAMDALFQSPWHTINSKWKFYRHLFQIDNDFPWIHLICAHTHQLHGECQACTTLCNIYHCYRQKIYR